MTSLANSKNRDRFFDNRWLSLMVWRYWGQGRGGLRERTFPTFDFVVSSFLINVLGLVLPIMMLQIYDRILPNEATATLGFLVVGVLIAIFFDALLRAARSYLTAWSGAVHDHELSTQLMNKVFDMSYFDFYRHSTSVRLEHLQSSSKLREFYSGQNFLTLLDIPFSLIFLGAIAYIGGMMALIPLVAIVMIAAVVLIHSRDVAVLSAKCDELETERMNVVLQTLKNIQTVKGQAMEDSLMRSYEACKVAQSHDTYRMGSLQSDGAVYGQALSALALIMTAVIGAIYAIQGALTVGGIAACVLLCGRAVQPAQKVISMVGRLGTAGRAIEAVDDVLQTPEPELLSVAPATGADVVGQVNLRNVRFRFEDNDVDFFDDVSLRVRAGETIAIQGDTGSGKSVLLSLIMGIYSPTNGKITIDGHQAHKIDRKKLIPSISYLPQHPDIVHGTILENITMFRTETHRQQSRHVAQILGLDDAVLRLPQGYNTVIGKGHASVLPDGMLKRIAIARALLEPARLVLFDEADDHLDPEGRNRLFRLMKELSGKCTLIMVSKNPSIFQFTNRCYILENGQLQAVSRNEVTSVSSLGLSQEYREGKGVA